MQQHTILINGFSKVLLVILVAVDFELFKAVTPELPEELVLFKLPFARSNLPS
jgi:hypothetical protein